MLEAAEIMNLKMWPAPTKTGAPYNFCFIKFLPNRMAEATEARQTMFRAPLTRGLGCGVESQLRTFPPLGSILMPNFIEIGPVVWIYIADTHGIHIDFYILRLL
jgi:hypothetical protein